VAEKAYLAIIVSTPQTPKTMVKDQKQTQKVNSKKSGGKREAELEDFFTNFLSKKVRNINKKLGHIQELENKKRQGSEELKKDQIEAISRKEE